MLITKENWDNYKHNYKYETFEEYEEDMKRILREQQSKKEQQKHADGFVSESSEEAQDYRRDFQRALREARAEEDRQKVYDPGEHETKTFGYIKEKYGRDLAERMLAAKRKNVQLDKDSYKKAMRIHHGKGPPIEAKDKTANKAKINRQWIRIYFELLDNQKFREKHGSEMGVYMWLRRHIVRSRMKHDRLNIYERYYKKGLLASSMSIKQIAKDFDMSRTTILKYKDTLVQEGCIKAIKIHPNEAWDNQKHLIYVFGTHAGGKDERYYIDEVYREA
jgi:hypothetical protein